MHRPLFVILSAVLAAPAAAQSPEALTAGAAGAFRNAVLAPVPVPDPLLGDEKHEKDEGYKTLRIEFEPVGKYPKGRPTKDNVLHLYTEPKTTGPLVLMLPMTGDSKYRYSRSLCKKLLENGFRCAYLERQLPRRDGLPDKLDELVEISGFPPHSAVAAQKALDVLMQMGFLEKGEKVGVAGLSLGAIDAALLAAWDTRVRAAALLLGGGNIPKMLTKIDGVGVKSYVRRRDAILKAEGITLEELEKRLAEKTTKADPLTYFREGPANPLAPERYLMINVNGDPAVPNECSDELCDAISDYGRRGQYPHHEVVSIPLLPTSFKHVGLFFAGTYVRPRVAEHFKKYLVDRP